MPLKRGSIVWAAVADQRGFVKSRPLVILSIGNESDPSMVCSCVTTRQRKPRPTTYVRIPWDKRGTSASGLTEPSFAVADWLVVVRKSEVRLECGELVGKSLTSLIEKTSALLRP
jgi:hypothetical protein